MNDYLMISLLGDSEPYFRKAPLMPDSAWNKANKAGEGSIIGGVYADWLDEHLSDLRSVTGTCNYPPKTIKLLHQNFSENHNQVVDK